MNVLNRFTLQNLKQNKKRTIVTIIGIALSTALICAVAGMVMSFQKTLVESVKRRQGDYHVRYESLPADQLKYIENNINLKEESFMYSKDLGYAELKNSENEYKPYLYVIAMDSKALNNNGLELIEGRMPENDGEILISEHIETNGKVKYKVGDNLTLNIGQRVLQDGTVLKQENPYLANEKDEKTGEDYKESIINTSEKTYKIVGIVSRPNYNLEGFDAPGYTVITYLDKNTIDENKEDLYTISALVKNVREYEEVIENIDKVLSNNIGHNYQRVLNSDLIRYEGGLSDETMQVLYSLAGIIILIIVVSSVFVIRNSFSISVSEKNRQYGMLASIGATSKQIKKSVLFEGLLIGLVGVPLGIICGIVAIIILIAIVNLLIGDMLSGDTFVYAIPISVILITIIIAAITIYLSCIIPARRAAKTSPIDAIRGKDDIKIKSKKVKTSRITKKLFGIGGVIASKNLKRSKKKYRTTVISLVVSITIFISLSSFLEYGRKLTGIYYTDMKYDIYVMGGTQKEYLEISKINNVTNYSIEKYIASLEVDSEKYATEYGKTQANLENNSTIINIVKYNNEYFKQFIKRLGLKESDYDKIAILEDDVMHYNEDGSKSLEEFYNIKDGQTVEGKIGEKDVQIKIDKVSTERPMGYESVYYSGGIIFIAEDYKLDVEEETKATANMFIESNEPQKVEDEINKLKKENDAYSEIKLVNYDTYNRQNQRMILLISIFLYGFIAVITLIGVTNIFNTITTNMILRSKEFAMLKSIGMTTKEFNRMIRLESILYGVKALMIGIPLGLLGSFAIYKSFAQELDCGYMFPVTATVLSIIFVFIIVGLTMKYSLGKINKQNIVETIRKDTV